MSERAEATGTIFRGDPGDTKALQRFRTLVNGIDDGIYQVDVDGRLVAVNDALADLTGYAREDLLGEHVSTLLRDDDGAAVERAIDRRVADPSDGTDAFDVAVRTAGGGQIPCELRLNAIVEDGAVRGAAGIVRDTGDRERAAHKRQLQRERDLTDRVLETSPVGILVVDGDGDVRRTNGRAREILDIADGDRGEYTPGDRTTYDEEGDPLPVDEHPFEIALATGEPVYDRILQEERPDGERRWLRVNAAPILSPDGEVDRVVTVGEDVTEIKERERQLEQSAQRYRTLVENFPNGAVALFDEDLRYTAVGGEALEDLVDSSADIVGQTVRERYPPELADQFESNFRAALRGEANTFEIDLHGRHWSAYTLPVEEGDGDISGGMIMVQDITEQKARQRALEHSERQYRTLVENFPNGAVALVDEDLRYRTIGGTAPKGVDAIDALEGLPAREALPPALAEKLVPGYEAAFDGESTSFEHESDGRFYQFRVVPVRGEDGDVFAAMGMSQDITERKEREQDLREAKTQLEAATEAGAVGTWEWHVPEDRFVAGASLARTFGVDPEEAREGVPLEQFTSSIYEGDRDRIERKIEEAVASCGAYEAEYRVWNADDELRWVVARGHVECDEDGDPRTFPGALTDITERKRAEEQLERHKDQLETLFEVLPVGVVVADADGELVEANEAAREIWGGEVFDAESVDEYDRYTAWWADTGEPVASDEWTMARVLRGEEIAEPDAFEIEAADGVRRIVTADGMPIRDERGEVVRGVVTVTDVTERREYRRKLEESEQRYRTLVENFPNGGVGVFDEDLRYTLVEGTMWDDIDPDADDLEGETVREALPPDTADDVEPIFRAALAGETGSVVSTLGGRTYRVWATPLRDADGAITAGQSFAVDITDQLERERQLEESNERLEQFAYAASHDLQEPLRMVSSYLQLIEDRYADELDGDAREFLAFAVDGAERMHDMIEGLLKYSRVDTRGDPFEPVELNAVLDDVRDDLQVKTVETGAEIDVDDLPRVEGDEGQLRQLFQNLIDNALEYSGDEPPSVRVGAERTGSEWTLSVSDEGIGIDPDDADTVFEVFQSLHTPDEHGGTGIGLALCERIVERHGGTIRVESEPGEGSTFYVTLPTADDGGE